MSQHHDPVHPDSGHLTAELLADLDEGLLDSESAEHAQAHLANCADCQDLHASVRDVSGALAQLSDVAMPEAVWDEISQSLAGAAPGVSGTTVVPLDAAPSRRAGWASRSLGAVAVAAGLLFVGALVVPMLNNSDNSGGTAADATGTQAESADGDNLSAYAATRSGRKYEPARLDAQVTQLVAHEAPVDPASTYTDEAEGGSDSPSPPTAVAPSGSALGATDLARAAFANEESAKVCLDQYLLAPDIEPLAIDIGRWQGRVAAIIVLPYPEDDTKIEVWVIDPQCQDTVDGTWHYEVIERP